MFTLYRLDSVFAYLTPIQQMSFSKSYIPIKVQQLYQNIIRKRGGMKTDYSSSRSEADFMPNSQTLCYL